MLSGKNIAFLGGGNMVEALVRGLLLAGLVGRDRVSVSARRAERREELRARLGVATTADNAAMARAADVLVLGVKPQDLPGVLDALRGVPPPQCAVVSIAAGVPTGAIADRLGGPYAVVRVMPNTPALVRAGASAYCLGRHATAAHGELAAAMFSSVGSVARVEEAQMDAVTALSGTGPAYIYYMLEALEEAGAAAGLPADVAARLATQTMLGAARMVVETGVPPAELRAQVTSPNGTTVAAMKVLEARGFRETVVAAVAAACRRSEELGRV
ncbi:MAG TPA: pyrroline-5-carboxylate reductase [Myxococcota bacterium]|jgi:pyrroline-5-carboxylate reductase|nr:pyrroline-5-carboxylate reductase [Myxococcota bacterium]